MGRLAGPIGYEIGAQLTISGEFCISSNIAGALCRSG